MGVTFCVFKLSSKNTPIQMHFNFMVSFQIEMEILLFTGYEIRRYD